jgi:hypothetical protein
VQHRSQTAQATQPAGKKQMKASKKKKKKKINLPEMRMSAFSRNYLLVQVLLCHSVDSRVPTP